MFTAAVTTGSGSALDEYIAAIDRVRGVAPSEVRGDFDAVYTYYTEQDAGEDSSGMPLDLLSENIAIHAAQEGGQDFWGFLS